MLAACKTWLLLIGLLLEINICRFRQRLERINFLDPNKVIVVQTHWCYISLSGVKSLEKNSTKFI